MLGICDIDDVLCPNEDCIKRAWLCDGQNDCNKNWDESNCDIVGDGKC